MHLEHLALPLATFVGNNTWFIVLITLHVLGAVIGLGPTFAFGIMGPMSGKVGPEGGMALLEAIEKIEVAMVTPILLTIQPATGVLMIFNRGLNHNFFSGHNAWLIAGIAAYLVAMVLAMGVQTPAVKKLIRLGKSGQGGSPEFGATVKLTQMMGPILTLLGIAIVVLMIWKPGSGCSPHC